MNTPSRLTRTLLAAAVLPAVWALAGPAALAQSTTPGVTAPSKERSLVFPSTGVIAEALVKEGDAVSADQPLMKLDDREEAKRLEALKIAADVERLKIKAAGKELDQARVKLVRSTDLFAKKAISEQELQEAQLAVDLAEVQVELAEQEAVAADAQTAVQEIRVDQMTLKSPADIPAGFILDVELGAGEFAAPNAERPVLKIVMNDPLYVDVKNLPSDQVAGLSVGGTLKVRYPNDQQTHDAKIIFIAPVADARSGTQSLKLEMPNPQNRAAGQNVDVLVPAADGVAARAR